jgi:hypothetical protein
MGNAQHKCDIVTFVFEAALLNNVSSRNHNTYITAVHQIQVWNDHCEETCLGRIITNVCYFYSNSLPIFYRT